MFLHFLFTLFCGLHSILIVPSNTPCLVSFQDSYWLQQTTLYSIPGCDPDTRYDEEEKAKVEQLHAEFARNKNPNQIIDPILNKTILRYAVEYSCLDLIKTLLQAGADPN